MKPIQTSETIETTKNVNEFLTEKPIFEKVNSFLERPIEISEEFLRESGRLDENIIVFNKKRDSGK
mgnify:CR=1 FL=1